MTPKQEARLIGRAIREGWNVSAEQRQLCVETLIEMVGTRDPELVAIAMDKLLKADAINIKIAEMEIKQKAKDDDHKLRLLELARSVPITDLARIASEHGITGPRN